MSEKKMSYCLDLLNRVRLNTKQVVIGELSLGGKPNKGAVNDYHRHNGY